MLDPSGIPTAVLTSGPALSYLNAYRASGGSDELRGTRAATPEDARDALNCLHGLSLIDVLQKTLESKRALRRQLAGRPVAEKLRMLDALRHLTGGS